MMPVRRYPLGLLIVFIGFVVWSAINPAMWDVWVAEMAPVLAVAALLVYSYRFFQFSDMAYSLMAVWLLLHTVGAHYTFANVPFQWVSDLLGSERNHFDRMAHFSVGFYAFPIAELLLRKKMCNVWLATIFALFSIMSIAATYEIIEWQFAVIAGGDAGLEFLGSQGDIWDAQKDMLADTLGALSSIALFIFIRPDRRAR